MRAVLTGAACALALGVAAVPAAAQSDAAAQDPDRLRPAGSTAPIGTELLSDERTITRWAHAEERAPIHRHPAAASASVGRLRLWTEDGFPEVYLALRSRVDDEGRVWVEVRIPGRPNGRRGWVPRDTLDALRIVRTRLVVDRRNLRATLYRSGRAIWRSRIGVGARGTPTPRGSFYVRERLRVPPGTIYGPWAFGTSAYSVLSDWPGGGVVGIHGTNRPDLIPGRPSHGCVRVPNPAVRRLARLMPVGTPVRIL